MGPQYEGFFGGRAWVDESHRAPNPLLSIWASEDNKGFPHGVHLTYEDAVSFRDELDAILARHDDAPQLLTSMAYNDPAAFVERYINMKDSPGAVVKRYGKGLTDYQKEILRSLGSNQKVAQIGGHGVGRTTASALAVLWFAITRELAGQDWKIVTTASRWFQLENFLWPEIHKWADRIRWDLLPLKPWGPEELRGIKLELQHGCAFSVSSTMPEYIEGVCAEQTLFVFDNAQGVPDGSYDAMEGAFSHDGIGGCQTFALISDFPKEPEGRFFNICAGAAGFEDWRVYRISKWQAIADGRITEEWADGRRDAWGEESAIYKNRVLGEFAWGAPEGDNRVITTA